MMVMRTTMGEIVMSKTPRRGTGRGMMIVCVVMMMMVMRTTMSKIVMSKT